MRCYTGGVVWCDVMNVMLQALAGEVSHWWCGVM